MKGIEAFEPVCARHKVLRGCMAFVLAFGLCGVAPMAALASQETAIDEWQVAADQMGSLSYQPYSYANTSTEAVPAANALEEEKIYGSVDDTSFDLRDHGLVTPVKLQNPWGTCWGFAAVAAAESSLLAEMGTTYEETPIDLSERHLAYFAYTATPKSEDWWGAPEGEAGYQGGEGAHNKSNDLNFMFNMGGLMVYATTMFASGCGPVVEKDAPYENEEGYIVCLLSHDDSQHAGDGAGDGTGDAAESNVVIMTWEEIEAEQGKGCKVTPMYYSDTLPSGDAATWGLDEELWNHQAYELEESNILPDTATFIVENDDSIYAFDEEAAKAWKSELVEGRAISVAFYADTSMPNQENNEAQYISSEWAHYTYQPAGVNHAVTIVGWDDEYPKENFAKGFATDEETQALHTPPADGAWLVKNSWGSETEEFPHNYEWGIVDDEGNHTGYFWISYYDQTISMAETFEFDLADYTGDSYTFTGVPEEEQPEYYIADQYDYLISGETLYAESSTPSAFANVFTATEDRTVRTLACETVKPNTTVTYQLYLLDENATGPVSGDPVVTIENTYEYGGFHRETLPKEQWVPMRAGQRYSVVVTQRYTDESGNTQYYQSTASNMAELSEKFIEETKQTYFDMMKNFVYLGLYSDFYDQQYEIAYEEYKANNPAAPEEEIAEAAAKIAEEKATTLAQEEIEKEYVEDMIWEMVNNTLGNLGETYYEAVVNEGESYTMFSDYSTGEEDALSVSLEGEWFDWFGIVPQLNSTYVYDNFPIKAYANVEDYASVDALTALENEVAKMEQILAGVEVSADGTDVAKDAFWVTEDIHNQFVLAIAWASGLLGAAGDNYKTELVLGTPTKEDVQTALLELSESYEKFDKAKQAGLKDFQKETVGGGNASNLAKTGDPVQSAVASAAFLAVVTGSLAVASVVRRRRQS